MSRAWSRWCARRAGGCMPWRSRSWRRRRWRPGTGGRSSAMTDLGGMIAGAAPLLAAHLALVLVALAVAVAVGLPLAVALARRPRLAAPVVTLAGAIQTVP